MSGHDEDEPLVPPKPKKRKGPTAAQTMGGVLFGFEQQVWRTAPPPQEVVHHARPDASVPAGDGSFLTITMPDDLRLAEDDEPAAAGDDTDAEAYPAGPAPKEDPR